MLILYFIVFIVSIVFNITNSSVIINNETKEGRIDIISSSLNIKNIKTFEEEIYKCYNNIIDKSYSIKVINKKFIRKDIIELVYIVDLDIIILPCNIDYDFNKFDQPVWKISPNLKNYLDNTDKRIELDKNYRDLVIINPKINDSGEYQCSKDDKEFKFNLIIIKKFIDLKAFLGTKFIISCGRDKSIEWVDPYLNYIIDDINNKRRVEIDINKDLVINSVENSDKGEYMCILNNNIYKIYYLEVDDDYKYYNYYDNDNFIILKITCIIIISLIIFLTFLKKIYNYL